MSVGPSAKKFNIVSNDHERMHKCDFSVFDPKFPFWANQNCQFKLKFSVSANSNTQNSVVVFAFSVLDRKHQLSGLIWSKKSKLSVQAEIWHLD